MSLIKKKDTTKETKSDTEVSLAKSQSNPVKIGLNGNIASCVYNFSNIALDNAIKGLRTQLMRFPGGSVPFDIKTYTYTETGQTNTLSDLKLLQDITGVDIVFVLQMVNFTMSDNIKMLTDASNAGLRVNLVEFGNEYNNMNNPGRARFPTATSYALTCKTWATEIIKLFPSARFGGVGENKQYGTRAADVDVIKWNDTVLQYNPNFKLVWHCYPNPDTYVTNGIVDLHKLESTIMVDYKLTGFDKIPSFWVTECNTKNDQKGVDTEPINSDQQTIAVEFIVNKVKSLGAEIVCVHNVVGKVGALDVNKKDITILPTGYGLEQAIQS